MTEENQIRFYTIAFDDKAVWGEFKEDLKAILREYSIKFQYSEKSPVFHLLYKSSSIKLVVKWEKDDSLVCRLELTQLSPEDISACTEIFEILQLFSGKLVEGTEPYEWG